MIRAIGIGAGGHMMVLLDCLADSADVEIVGVLDPQIPPGSSIGGVKVLGGDDELLQLRSGGVTHGWVGVGGLRDRSLRQRLFVRLTEYGFEPLTIVHARAIVSARARLSRGAQVMPGAIVNAGTQAGENCIVNSGAVVEHDCVLGDHSHIAPGAVLAGGVMIGALTHIGAAAVVREGIRIGREVVIGAGSVVTRDIADGSTAWGVPARVRS